MMKHVLAGETARYRERKKEKTKQRRWRWRGEGEAGMRVKEREREERNIRSLTREREDAVCAWMCVSAIVASSERDSRRERESEGKLEDDDEEGGRGTDTQRPR